MVCHSGPFSQPPTTKIFGSAPGELCSNGLLYCLDFLLYTHCNNHVLLCTLYINYTV